MSRSTEIKFTVLLDDRNLPETMEWEAMDGGLKEKRKCKSMMISLWDPEEKNTMRIDLWTKDMPLDEMHTHFLQTLITMAESYQKATQNPHIIEDITTFCRDAAEKIKEYETKRRNG